MRRMKNHRWGKTKSDWFHTKAGKDYCPDHIPDFVKAWREKENNNAER